MPLIPMYLKKHCLTPTLSVLSQSALRISLFSTQLKKTLAFSQSPQFHFLQTSIYHPHFPGQQDTLACFQASSARRFSSCRSFTLCSFALTSCRSSCCCASKLIPSNRNDDDNHFSKDQNIIYIYIHIYIYMCVYMYLH